MTSGDRARRLYKWRRFLSILFAFCRGRGGRLQASVGAPIASPSGSPAADPAKILRHPPNTSTLVHDKPTRRKPSKEITMPPATTALALETTTIRRVSWRLMPFLLLAYLICYIDRVNVGFASLQMNKAVGIDPKTYGLGAGIFFIGYFILEVPSNLALERFGARTWIARIMITWGLVSAAFALIGGPISFLVLRFLLGAAEAGFFPGVILYITYWYPAHYRAIIVGIFIVAIPVAGLIGSPISGAILYMNGVLGLGGWQWIFLLEAAPAILLGVLSFVWLTDRPEHATWLRPEQKAWLIARLDDERRRTPRVSHASIWRVMGNKYVLIMALVYSGAAGASTSLALWMPQLVKSFGLTNWQTGLLNA